MLSFGKDLGYTDLMMDNTIQHKISKDDIENLSNDSEIILNETIELQYLNKNKIKVKVLNLIYKNSEGIYIFIERKYNQDKLFKQECWTLNDINNLF